MIFGQSFLGLAKYARIAANSLPKGWASGCFAVEFGDCYGAVDLLLSTGKCPIFRLQCLWDGAHNYTERDLLKIQAISKKFNPIIRKFPQVQFRISPICEHKIKDQKLLGRFKDAVMNSFERPIYVNSPMTGGAMMTGVINEIHGGPTAVKGQFQFDYDGTPAEDANVENHKGLLKDADVFYLWCSRYNGRWSANDKTPIDERRGWPDANYIQAISFLSTPKGATSLPKGWLYKAFAETHNAADPKGGKPVMIAPVRANEIQIRDKKGNMIDVLGYYGPFSDGKRHRYYGKQMGHLRAKKAIQNTNDPVCSVWCQGKRIGSINPGFRENEWR